jgi:hypothetical protein
MSDEIEDGDDCGIGDCLIPGPELEGGGCLAIHHKPDHSIEPAIMYPFKEGSPISEDARIAVRREGSDYYEMSESISSMKKGPPNVTTKAYREGFDRIFGNKNMN